MKTLTTLLLLAGLPNLAHAKHQAEIGRLLRVRELQSGLLGKYDKSMDHLEVLDKIEISHFAHSHCIGAMRMLFDYYDIDATVVAGTASPQKQQGFAPFGNEIDAMNLAFPLGQCNGYDPGNCMGSTSQVGWANADADWDHNPQAPLVSQIGAMWKSTLENGGDVWIVEGGMGDFTLHVALWVRDHSAVDLKKIHSVQHSNWNINNSGPGVYDQLENLIDSVRVTVGDDKTVIDGNGKLNSNIGGDKFAFVDKAAKGVYATLWAKIWEGDGGWQNKIDFSDTIELLWILELIDFVEDYDSTQKPWENFMDIYNVIDGPVSPPVPAPVSVPAPVLVPAPVSIPTPLPTNAPTTTPFQAPPTICGKDLFQGQCSTTSQCKQMYASAYDCKNNEGGVCYCAIGSVCGCLAVIDNPTSAPVVSPAPVALSTPAPASMPTTCGKQDFLGECAFTYQCKSQYGPNSYDCKNSEGGVCFCGNNQVCGCLPN